MKVKYFGKLAIIASLFLIPNISKANMDYSERVLNPNSKRVYELSLEELSKERVITKKNQRGNYRDFLQTKESDTSKKPEMKQFEERLFY